MKRIAFGITAALMCQAGLWAQIPPGANAFQPADMLNAGRGGGRGGPMPRSETGKPFSATATTQTVQTFADGTRITQSTSMVQYRDADGRVRTETTESAGPNSEPVKVIMIRDIVAAVTYRLDPVKRTALTSGGPIPAIAAPAARGGGFGNGNAIPAGSGGRRGGAPSSRADMEATLANLQKAMEAMREARTNPNETVEDLGMSTVNGVPARGTRTTTVVPVGAIGNDREFRSVTERWFSSDLNMMVKSVSTDPRFGTTTFELTNISRQPPDPSLFRVPADYTVTQPNNRQQ